MNERNGHLSLALLLCFGLASACCAGRSMPVQMRGIQLRSVRPDFSTQSVEMKFDVRFRLNNPTSTSVPIPAHAAEFELDGNDVGTVDSLFPVDTELPGNGSVDLDYRVQIDTGLLSPSQREELLGRDVPYRFAANFEIPLPEELAGVPDIVGWDPKVALSFEDVIRVPLLPEAQLWGSPALDLLGGDITVVELDLNLEILEGLKQRSGDAVYLLTDGNADQKNAARESWWTFFDAITDTDVEIVQMTPVTGMKVRVPIRITNPNEFEIALPSLAVDLDAGSKDVWTVKQSPSTGTLQKKGQSGSSRDVTYESTFHFDGLGDLVIPSSQRELEVDTSVDLGHGSIELPIRIP
jgi:LEA14-like dessication related protein